MEPNNFSAYKLLQPISQLYSEECTKMFQGLQNFCQEFDGSNIVELSDEYYKTKEMCVTLRVGDLALTYHKYPCRWFHNNCIN